MSLRRAARMPNQLRVPDPTRGFSRLDVGEVAISTASHTLQSRVCSIRSFETESNGARAHSGPHLPGSESCCAGERQVEGHERRGPSLRRTTHRSGASGLPWHHGVLLAVDITLRSATSADGLPHPSAAHTNGAVLARARTDKDVKYTELGAGNRCFLVVVALETGGRWSSEAVEFGGHDGGSACTRSDPSPSSFNPFGAATSMDVHAGSVVCVCVRQFPCLSLT